MARDRRGRSDRNRISGDGKRGLRDRRDWRDGRAAAIGAFFPITETPEDDYIVQVRFESDEAWGYAFMWPQGEDHWIQISPRILDEGEGPALRAAHCVMLPFGECQIQSAQALRDIYLTQIYQSGARESLGEGVMVQSSLGSAARTKVSP